MARLTLWVTGPQSCRGLSEGLRRPRSSGCGQQRGHHLGACQSAGSTPPR